MSLGVRGPISLNRDKLKYLSAGWAGVFWRIVLAPRILAFCERFLLPNFLLTASQAIQIEPSETPQPFHSDDAFHISDVRCCAAPRPPEFRIPPDTVRVFRTVGLVGNVGSSRRRCWAG